MSGKRQELGVVGAQRRVGDTRDSDLADIPQSQVGRRLDTEHLGARVESRRKVASPAILCNLHSLTLR